METGYYIIHDGTRKTIAEWNERDDCWYQIMSDDVAPDSTITVIKGPLDLDAIARCWWVKKGAMLPSEFRLNQGRIIELLRQLKELLAVVTDEANGIDT